MRRAPVLLAVLIDNPRELGLGLLVDDVVGAQLLLAIHPHIERPVEPETETALRVVERETAHPEVGDNCAHTGDSALVEDLFETGEIPPAAT